VSPSRTIHKLFLRSSGPEERKKSTDLPSEEIVNDRGAPSENRLVVAWRRGKERTSGDSDE